MLAVLLLNRMTMKRRIARKQKLSKPDKVEIKTPEVSVCRTCLSTEELESIFINKDSEKKRSHDLKLVTGLECNLCHQREKSKKRLQVHKYKMHKVKRYKYVCPVCRDVFARPGNVRLHLTRCHGVLRVDQVDSIERVEVDTSILPEIIRNTKMFNFGNT